ncbi:putative superfamily III holin-X [Brevibacterium sanguinis]|uniref:Superfamily III holin-X n=2 Tax=Brevibacterium TaxID=1696 RepID=A0ABX9GQX7_9MICO|nr:MULTISPECIES: phage holin family protein [Brevibacterium]RBP63398.1 putative superfamily III holin-X [Brevibacterium sanguinis]RBP69865.1 putative superfamily III holin-X [Brevibacterium celere]
MAERSISELIKDIGDDSKAIAEEEVALAKAEATAGAKNLGIGSALAIVALFFLFLSSFMVIFAGASAFHEGLGWPWWGSFLMVFGILAVIAIVLLLVALPLFKKGNPVPVTAIGLGKSIVAAVKRALSNPSGPRY